METDYSVSVESDTHEKGKWMVVIRRKTTDEIVGIPVRNKTYEEAEEMANPCRYAYEFGLNEVRLSLGSVWFNVKRGR
jgi:hypothetical protein